MEELLDPVQEETVAETAEVVDIQFRPGQKIYFFDPDGMQFEVGDHVVMDTARGAEFGICAGGNHIISAKDVVAPLRKILRKATPQDEHINAENRAKEKRAFEICMQKVEQHGLDMQMVSAECAFDGSKILFYFTADERVDFRELVKDLASVFHTRIELRQIGVRDKAKMVGGLGICGRPFCCASFLDDFQPVSIKMAKTQNLSLNPTKISGTCGRLMCCLKYEQDTYESLIRSSPKVDSFVDTPEGRGTVVDVELLRERVKVQMENNPETVSVFHIEEIAVLRSGKARKSDPPIPDDLAPISGSGQRPRKPKVEEEAPMLDPIRFRYSTEAIVEEPAAPAEEVTEGAEDPQPVVQRAPRQRRRKGGHEAEPAKPAAEQPRKEEQPAEAAEDAEAPKSERANRPRRDRNRQRRREDKPAAPENAEKQPEHREKPERPARPEKAERAEKAERPEKPERPERGDKPENAERADRPRHNRPRRGHKPSGEAQGNAAPNPSSNAAPAADGEARMPHRRNNYHNRRKPKAPGGGAE